MSAMKLVRGAIRAHFLKLATLSISLLALIFLACYALVTRVPTEIPQLVDQARGVIGPEAVALAEDRFYAASDAYDRWSLGGHKTPGYWTVTDTPQPAVGTPMSRLEAHPQLSALDGVEDIGSGSMHRPGRIPPVKASTDSGSREFE